MKRLAFLSVVSLMLASAVFAPVAMAQEVGEVDVQSVRLGPGGSVIVTGTIECVEGYFVDVTVDVRQRTGHNALNHAQLSISGTCSTTETTAFTLSEFSTFERPFHRGPATVATRNFFCDPSGTCQFVRAIEAVHIR
jgi:hypothetical protein